MTRSAPRKAALDADKDAGDVGVVTSELELEDARVLLSLCGPRSELLPLLEREIGVDASLRGHKILLSGAPAEVALAERFLAEAAGLAAQGVSIDAADVGRALRMLRTDPSVRLKDMFDESIALGVGRRPIGPRGLAQKRYVEAVRSHDLTFGIGPAGTGKTYLAMACAVSALHERKVKRIVLTRPAVEAGEKLGFLPGDLAEKVNPYLRHDGPRSHAGALVAGSDRGRSARVHARTHAERFVRDLGRGAKYDGGTDADVLDAPRV
jgi:phosphate starvation-inducible protein PhoH and related proteins